VFVTRLQDFSGSMEWFVHGSSLLWPEGDFLWDDVQGDPCSHSAVLSRCPLDVGRIQRSMHIVLREACGPSAAKASIITKYSARKTLVSDGPHKSSGAHGSSASNLVTGRGQYSQYAEGS
jgi:hypothetical protein